MTPPVTVVDAVKVTDAIPFTVLACVLTCPENDPAHGQMDVIAKVTTVPSETGLFAMFRTSAVMFVVWPLVRFGLTMLRLRDAGGLVIRILACMGLLGAVDVAVTVTVPEEVPA
jgi:hypothetical protein